MGYWSREASRTFGGGRFRLRAVVDYSNCADGYVMVQYTASTEKRLKALVDGPTTRYQYNLTAEHAALYFFPLKIVQHNPTRVQMNIPI